MLILFPSFRLAKLSFSVGQLQEISSCRGLGPKSCVRFSHVPPVSIPPPLALKPSSTPSRQQQTDRQTDIFQPAKKACTPKADLTDGAVRQHATGFRYYSPEVSSMW